MNKKALSLIIKKNYYKNSFFLVSNTLFSSFLRVLQFKGLILIFFYIIINAGVGCFIYVFKYYPRLYRSTISSSLVFNTPPRNKRLHTVKSILRMNSLVVGRECIYIEYILNRGMKNKNKKKKYGMRWFLDEEG